MNDGTAKFYWQYIDDTLLVVKPQNVSRIHKMWNGFYLNLQIAVDFFENEVSHFFDLETSLYGISIYWKDTKTGLHLRYTSFVPWSQPDAWISRL